MKEKSYIFCFVAFIIIFIMAFFAGDYLGNKENKIVSDKTDARVWKEEETRTETIETSRSNTTGAGYWIKAENEYIVIYNYNGELVSNTEIGTWHFSEQEKKILENGIYVESAEDLFRYLESYTS